MRDLQATRRFPNQARAAALLRHDHATKAAGMYALDAALSASAANPSERLKTLRRREHRWRAFSLFRRASSAATLPIHPAETSIADRS
jgi:hypothetical protein